MRRMYATRWDTRGGASLVLFRWRLHCLFYDDCVKVILDPTDEYHLIFLITCTAKQYEFLARSTPNHEAKDQQIEWDYFNFNEIEEQ